MSGHTGFTADETRTDSPTRAARLTRVLVVDPSLPAGRAVNAAVCVAAATVTRVEGLLGPDALDADGSAHPGLPWAGCSILAATPAELAAVRARVAARPDVFVADMPAAAQQTRVYDGYLDQVAGQGMEDLELLAVSVIGPRNFVDEVVGRLPLLP